MKSKKRPQNKENNKENSSSDKNQSGLTKMQALSKQIEELGFVIRKEKLKQGFGWKCNSGSCFFKGRPVLFIDTKLSLDEQVDFLSSFLANLSTQANLDKSASIAVAETAA